MAIDPIANFAIQRASNAQRAGDAMSTQRWFRAAACILPWDARLLPLAIVGDLATRSKIARRSLCLDPLSALLLEALGQMTQESGDERLALKFHRKALLTAPGTPIQAALVLAQFLRNQNKPSAAYPFSWLSALSMPGNAGAQILLATVLNQLGKFEQSSEAFAAASTLVPTDVGLLATTAWSFRTSGNIKTADMFARKALALTPNEHIAQIVAAKAAADSDDENGTANWSRRIALSAPRSAENWYRSAEAWTHFGNHSESWRIGRRALILNPMHRLSMELLARNAVSLFWFAEAHPLTQAAMTFYPSSAELLFHHSEVEKVVGRLGHAWDLERDRDKWARFHKTVGLPPRLGAAEPVPSDKLLVAGEQGLGDELTFLSCLPDLLESCPAPIVEADDRLHPLLQRAFPTITLIGRQLRTEAAKPVADYRTLRQNVDVEHFMFAGDLPARYRRERVVNESRRGYLTPAPEKVASWRQALKPIRGDAKLLIGLAWSSGVRNSLRKQFNSNLDMLLDILTIPNVRFVCLQYHDCREEVDVFKAEFGIDIWIPSGLDQRDDLDGTAALMKALDLVVSTDTAPCLIAAGTGCETLRLSMSMFGLHPERDLFFANMLPLIRTDETVDIQVAAKRAALLIQGRLA